MLRTVYLLVSCFELLQFLQVDVWYFSSCYLGYGGRLSGISTLWLNQILVLKFLQSIQVGLDIEALHDRTCSAF